MYYYCNDCKQFVIPILADDGATEMCTNCGSGDIESAGECKICGYSIRSSEDYCKDCQRLAERYVIELAAQLEITTDKAKDLIMSVMEKED